MNEVFLKAASCAVGFQLISRDCIACINAQQLIKCSEHPSTMMSGRKQKKECNTFFVCFGFRSLITFHASGDLLDAFRCKMNTIHPFWSRRYRMRTRGQLYKFDDVENKR